MSCSGGEVSKVGIADKPDSFTSDETTQIEEAFHAMEVNGGVVIGRPALHDLYLEHQRLKEQLGFDKSDSFATTFLKFVGGLSMTPTDFVEAFHEDLLSHAFDATPSISNAQKLSIRYHELRSRGDWQPSFATRLYLATEVAANSLAPHYMPILQKVHRLITSADPAEQRIGAGLLELLFPLDFEAGALSLNSPIARLLSYYDVESGRKLAEWKKILQSKVDGIIEIPAVDPLRMDAYAQQANAQIHALVKSVTDDMEASVRNLLPGGAIAESDKLLPYTTMASLWNSLQVLLREGHTELAGQLLNRLNKLEGPSLEMAKALTHIAASKENLPPERVFLIEKIFGLIVTGSSVTDVEKVRNGEKILSLAIAYLGSSRPNAQVDNNLAILLGKLFNQTLDSSQKDGEYGIPPAYFGERLVSAFLYDLMRQRDVSSSAAPRLLELAATRKLNFIQISLMMKALRQDMMRGTEPFEQAKLEKYLEILFDSDPEVADLLNQIVASTEEYSDDYLFEIYDEIKRAGGKGGHGDEQGPIVPGGGAIAVPPVPAAPAVGSGGLSAEFFKLAEKFERANNQSLGRLALEVALMAKDDAYSDYFGIFNKIHRLLISDVPEMQSRGEKLLQLSDGPNPYYPLLDSLSNFDEQSSQKLAEWKNFLKLEVARMARIIKVTEVDHAEDGLPQFKSLVGRLADHSVGPAVDETAGSIVNSLQILLDNGQTGLIRSFFYTLRQVREMGDEILRDSVHALIHIAASEENLTGERIAFINNVLNLIKSIPVSDAGRSTLFLEILYLAKTRPNTEVDLIMAGVLGTYIHRLREFFTEEHPYSFSITPKFEMVQAFLENLIHRPGGDVSGSVAAQLLKYQDGLPRLNSLRISLIIRALRQDELAGTLDYNPAKVQQYLDILLDPEAQELLDRNTKIDSHNGAEGKLFRKYDAIKRKGGGGSGEKSGPVSPNGAEEPPAPVTPATPPAGQTKSASMKGGHGYVFDAIAKEPFAQDGNTGTVVPIGAQIESRGMGVFAQ